MSRVVRDFPFGVVTVLARFNNTIVTVADVNGNVKISFTAGRCGFSGKDKATAYAAQKVVRSVLENAIFQHVKTIEINLVGQGVQREASLKELLSSGLVVKTINEKSRIAHGGVKPRKNRRV